MIVIIRATPFRTLHAIPAGIKHTLIIHYIFILLIRILINLNILSGILILILLILIWSIDHFMLHVSHYALSLIIFEIRNLLGCILNWKSLGIANALQTYFLMVLHSSKSPIEIKNWRLSIRFKIFLWPLWLQSIFLNILFNFFNFIKFTFILKRFLHLIIIRKLIKLHQCEELRLFLRYCNMLNIFFRFAFINEI